jgi:hypothetical protein
MSNQTVERRVFLGLLGSLPLFNYKLPKCTNWRISKVYLKLKNLSYNDFLLSIDKLGISRNLVVKDDIRESILDFYNRLKTMIPHYKEYSHLEIKMIIKDNQKIPRVTFTNID